MLKLDFPESFTMTTEQCELDFMQTIDSEGQPTFMFGIYAAYMDGREYGGLYSFSVQVEYGAYSETLFERDLETSQVVTNLSSIKIMPYEDIYIQTINTSNPIYPYMKLVTFN